MYLVFQALDPEHRLVLALTCRVLHGFHAAVRHFRNQQLTRDQHLEYLACIARSLPEQWVCEACLELHAINPFDTPENPMNLTCPLGWADWGYTAYGLGWSVSNRRTIRLDHRHVQVALKHLRLRNEASEYANKLLAARHYENSRTYDQELSWSIKLAARCSVYPKAKTGADGQLRYLTLTTWRFQRDGQAISLDDMGDLKICTHLGVAPYLPPPDFRYPQLWRNPFLPHDFLAVAVLAALGQQQQQQQQQEEEDHDHDGNSGASVVEVCGACPRCPTDYAVRASRECVELMAWRDLGPEGSPMSLAWRVQVSDLRPDHWNSIHVGLTLDHEPGSVRALYEGAGEGLESTSGGVDLVTDTGCGKG
ncbi:hypothetical protein BR93DRAFT_967350 [Coniochaeta sp. PMI_546]|nr:hypothetical protein BR93DRAFT_967350 [Coniochaeta sp. PMI_546]